MKRAIVAVLLSALAVTYARADLIWNETFPYVDGPINAVGTNSLGVTNWFRHSGSGNDALVSNHKLQVSATGGTVSRADDVNRPITGDAGSPYTNFIPLYASFTINCTNLPTVTNYFAHFLNGSSYFYGRLWALPGSTPGTWRLGISGSASTMNKVFPADLAPNVNYQVVVMYDPSSLSLYGTLWVDPMSSSDTSVSTSDSVTGQKSLQAFAFRQSSSFGSTFFNITNLTMATTFDEAATNVWPSTPVAPIIGSDLPGARTNFVGDNVIFSIVAAGQGLANMSYQWQKNGGSIDNPAGNSNVLTINGAQTSDSGTYTVTVTSPNGQFVTSASSYLLVTNPPVPPALSQQPTNQNVYPGQTATFTVAAGGSGLSYSWKYNNGPLPANASGDGTTVLTVSNVQTNNGTTGTYRCDVSNAYGTTPSANAVLSVTPVPVVSIGYLRTLVDSVYFLPTNLTAYYCATGIVTSFCDMTAPQNASFVMQDGTNGIGVFMAGGYATMPQGGDAITVVGPLSSFNGMLQFNLNANDPSTTITVTSSGNLQPAGTVLPFNFTNGAAVGGIGTALRYYGGRVVTFTNVYFPVAFGGPTNFTSGSTYAMTNAQGESFKFFMNAAMTNLNGYPIPTFAYIVRGPMGMYLNNTTTDRSSGYEMTSTRIEDIVTTPPPAVTSSIALVGGKPSLTWVAQPFMSYSILRASNVSGPYLPLVTGLTFNTTAGQFIDTAAGTGPAFYRIVSP